MPGAPYFHGDEEFYLLGGALIAYRRPFRNRHGLECVGIVKVLTTDRKYQLGHGIEASDGFFDGFVCGDARVDRRHGLRSLEELVAACREVFGLRPRYAIAAPEIPATPGPDLLT